MTRPLELLVVSSFGPQAEAMHRLAAGLPVEVRFATDFPGLRRELEARRPDLVLVDRWLLEDAAPRCVALVRTAYDLPVVLLVARPEEGEAFPETVDGVLLKPLKREDLEALLAQWQPEAAAPEAAVREEGTEAHAAGALRLLDEVRETLRRLAEVIQVDSLTGLFHRDVFLERAQKEVLRARRYGHPLSLLLVDVDDFKSINDRFGHERGNQVLAVLGQLLRENLRRDLDLAARLHGDELAVLLPATPLEGARRVAERLLRAVAAQEGAVPFQVTIGAAELNRENAETGLQELLEAADRALLAGKRRAKGTVHVEGRGEDRSAAEPEPAAKSAAPRALLVVEEPEVAGILTEALAQAGIPAEVAPDRARALQMLDSLEFFGVFLEGDPEAADIRLFLESVARLDPSVEVFLFVPPGREAASAHGVHQVPKPFQLAELVAAARRARKRFLVARSGAEEG